MISLGGSVKPIIDLPTNRRYNFYAAGNYGQFIYIIPEKNIVTVRQGFNSGYDNWTGLFKDLGSVA
jgi:hypothetical protein